MITLITTNNRLKNFKLRIPVVVKDDLQEVINFVKVNKIIAFDFETTGLNVHYLEPLLLAISDGVNAYVIDVYGYKNNVDFINLMQNGFNDKVLLGHNLKFDYSILLYHYKVDEKRIHLFDSLIICQRLWQGYDLSNDKINGIKFSLDSMLKLYDINAGKNKEVTEEFIGIDPETFIYKTRHIKYAAEDVLPLFKLKDKLKVEIQKAQLTHLIYNIELPLIKVLAKAELEPLYIDEDNWILLHKEKVEELYKIDCELDDFVRINRENSQHKKMLSDGKYDRSRTKKDLIQTVNLFGEVSYIKPKKTEAFIDWNSDQSVIKIIAKLGLICPYKESEFADIEYIVPILNNDGTVDKGYSVSATNIDLLLVNGHLDDTTREFYTKLKKRNSLSNLISTFGITFLAKKNRVTDGFHTIFRQCRATNGRLQSGGGKSQPDKYNCQNIPADNSYRNLFSPNKKGEDNYFLVGIDLVGAEAVIMADKARDKNFLDNVEDLHSYMGTLCWREVFKYRIENNIDKDYYKELIKTFKISKSENKQYRNPFKRVTFGIPYGAAAYTVAKALKITEEEASVILNTYNTTVPKVMKLMKDTYFLALRMGKVVLNYRSNSCIHLPAIEKTIKTVIANNGDYNPYKDLIKSDKRQAEGTRNYIISGTQADALKEAMVVLNDYIVQNNLDITIMLQVHDELQVRCNNKYLEPIILYKGKLITAKELVDTIVLDTCNLYLNYTKFKVESEISKVWKK